MAVRQMTPCDHLQGKAFKRSGSLAMFAAMRPASSAFWTFGLAYICSAAQEAEGAGKSRNRHHRQSNTTTAKIQTQR